MTIEEMISFAHDCNSESVNIHFLLCAPKGLYVNLEYRDLENGDLESRSWKRDCSIPCYHALPSPPHRNPTHTPRQLPQPHLQQYSRSSEINLRLMFLRFEKAVFENIDFYSTEYRVCHGFRLTKRDDYFWVDIEYFQIELHF